MPSNIKPVKFITDYRIDSIRYYTDQVYLIPLNNNNKRLQPKYYRVANLSELQLQPNCIVQITGFEQKPDQKFYAHLSHRQEKCARCVKQEVLKKINDALMSHYEMRMREKEVDGISLAKNAYYFKPSNVHSFPERNIDEYIEDLKRQLDARLLKQSAEANYLAKQKQITKKYSLKFRFEVSYRALQCAFTCVPLEGNVLSYEEKVYKDERIDRYARLEEYAVLSPDERGYRDYSSPYVTKKGEVILTDEEVQIYNEISEQMRPFYEEYVKRKKECPTFAP